MDFLDDAVTKAKEVIDVVSQKTGEVVGVGKQKLDIATLESKRKKDFELLGMLYFEKVKDETVEDDSIGRLIVSITEKNEKIDRLKAEVNSAKNKRTCPHCGALIEKDSIYCSICGEKLVEEPEEDSAEPENTEEQ